MNFIFILIMNIGKRVGVAVNSERFQLVFKNSVFKYNLLTILISHFYVTYDWKACIISSKGVLRCKNISSVSLLIYFSCLNSSIETSLREQLFIETFMQKSFKEIHSVNSR